MIMEKIKPAKTSVEGTYPTRSVSCNCRELVLGDRAMTILQEDQKIFASGRKFLRRAAKLLCGGTES